jgi:hypothetical protein
MPILLDNEPRPVTPPAPEACDWKVVPIMRGRVTLTTSSSLFAPAMAVTFTTATLPQLRQIVALLEKDQPAS